MKQKFSAILMPFFSVLICYQVTAQTKIVDSIRSIIHTAKNDEQKLSAILGYCDLYQSLDRDTAYDYALLALSMAKATANERSMVRAQLALANAYSLWGWVDSAGAVCDSALKKISPAEPDTRDVYFNLLRQKALCYGAVEKYPETLDLFYQLLREAEQYNDKITIAATCNSIGSVNINMNKPDNALAWIKRALGYDTKNEKFLPVKAAIFANEAYAYLIKGNYDSALHYANRALPICRQVQNLNTLATVLRIRSNIFAKLRQNTAAETDLIEMQKIRRILNGGNNSTLTDDNIQLANFYAGTGQLEKAIVFIEQNLRSGDVYTQGDSVSFTNNLNVKLEYYKVLAGFYKQGGMQKKYTATLEDIIAAKDSFYAANSSQAIADIQTKYETEQKEKTILQQKYDLTKKNFLVYGSLTLMWLSGIIFYLLMHAYRRKQKIKMQLAMEKEKSQKQIAVKEAEEKERKRIAADLHDHLGVQANTILYTSEMLKTGGDAGSTLVGQLNDSAKDMLFFLRETLWALKSSDVSAESIWLRILNFIAQMKRTYSTIKFETSGKLPKQAMMPSAKGLNILMIIQEAVNNAIKHSKCNSIKIITNFNEDFWQLFVTDDGIGFDHAIKKTNGEHYGLDNMKQRAENSGFGFNMSNRDGTNVCIEIPTRLVPHPL